MLLLACCVPALLAFANVLGVPKSGTPRWLAALKGARNPLQLAFAAAAVVSPSACLVHAYS